jgi:hypothetical protein
MTAVAMVFPGFLMAMRTPGLQILPRIYFMAVCSLSFDPSVL